MISSCFYTCQLAHLGLVGDFTSLTVACTVFSASSLKSLSFLRYCSKNASLVSFGSVLIMESWSTSSKPGWMTLLSTSRYMVAMSLYSEKLDRICSTMRNMICDVRLAKGNGGRLHHDSTLRRAAPWSH